MFSIGAFAIIFDESGRFLLCHRRDIDVWNLPGGKVEHDELPTEAAIRETKEETGLDVEINRLLDVIDNIVYDDDGKICYHYVLIDYLCSSSHGDLKAATDVKEAKWIKLKDLNRLSTTKTLKRLLVKANIMEEGAPLKT